MPLTIDALRRMNTRDALEAAYNLDAATRKQLWIACPAVDHRILLVLNVMEKLVMDDGFTGGISGVTSNASGAGTIGDYGEVRMFLMKKLALQVNRGKVDAARNASWGRWFYPEYRSIGSVRERFARIAEDHVKTNFSHVMQIILFSMNGYFNWDGASKSAHTFSTCALFVRACRAAARILETKSWATDTPAGTDACIIGPNRKSSIIYSERGSREPKRGDIFHVNSPNKNNAHVGIILKHRRDALGNWYWKTAEAGQGTGFETRLFDERVIKYEGGKHWHGDSPNRRPVVKWIDIEALAKDVTGVTTT